jgi:hypothetical protein
MNLSEMTYKEMVEMSATLQQAMAIKRVNEVKEALRILMDAYGLSKDEMKSCLDGEDSINPITPLEVVENPQIEDEVPLALPEPSKEDEMETEVSINPEPQEENNVEPKVTSVFDLPELKAPYNLVAAKKSEAPAAPEKIPVENSDEELSSLEDLLSDDPEYKAFYHPATPVKKNHRSLPTLDELLSGEPINRILCQGNLEPKGAAYRQHSRVCHADGIIPTETATGQTLVYIPPAPPVAA